MLRNALMILNGKGGVLKTTLTAQIAGLAAISGWRVLAVDLDQQANLARDLGYVKESDGGAGLLRSVVDREPLEPIRGVRPNLDVIAGGPDLNRLYRHLTLESGANPLRAFDELEQAIKPIAAEYELIVFDSPPGGESVHLEAMSAVHAVVIPTQADQGSIDGLATVFRTVSSVRKGPNPNLEVLGVALGPVPSQSTRLRADTVAQLDGLVGGKVHVFETVVRSAISVAVDCRERGFLVHEYEAAAAEATPWYKQTRDQRRERRGFSQAASGLAGDYQALVGEILGRFHELRVAA